MGREYCIVLMKFIWLFQGTLVISILVFCILQLKCFSCIPVVFDLLLVRLFHYLGVDILVEPLRQTLQTKVKANSVKQEFEKQDELKRSALRAVVALLSIQDSGEFLIRFWSAYAVRPFSDL